MVREKNLKKKTNIIRKTHTDAPIQRVREVNKILLEVCGPSYAASPRDIRDSSQFGADNVHLNAEVSVYHAARIFYRLIKLVL